MIVEVQFYLLAAATSFAGALVRRRAAAVGAACVLALCLYLYVAGTGSYFRFFGMFQFAPFFVLGVAGYFVLGRRDARMIPLGVIAGGLFLHAYHAYLSRGIAEVEVELSTALFFAGCILFGYLATSSANGRVAKLDRRLGDLTYALYLVHMSSIALALHFGLEGTAGFAFSAAGALVAALAIHHGVEQPLVRVRSRLRGREL